MKKDPRNKAQLRIASTARRCLPQAGAPGVLCVTIRAVDPIDSLASRLPRGAVSTDPQILRERAIDSWTLGLLRQVRGDELLEPAAVVFPTSTEDVATVLSWAAPMRIPVITRGGGSGVCGGASGAKASVVLDMSRMDKVTDVDLTSRVVHVQAGVRGDQLEDVLAADGLTVGHYPQSLAMSTVGGWIAASSAGQASTGFGAIEDVLLGLTAVLPTGRILRCRPVPRSAAGPDLRRLLVGSEGTFAVVTEATLACRPRPAGWQWLAFGFPSFDTLADGLRDAVRAETGAVICRGYDQTDAQLSFGPLGHSGGCVGLLGFPVGLPGMDERMAAAAAAVGAAGTRLDSSYGDHWWRHRNDAVDTYARIMGPDRAFG
jgi:alkyldihydroxyacetonephosphate synthase